MFATPRKQGVQAAAPVRLRDIHRTSPGKTEEQQSPCVSRENNRRSRPRCGVRNLYPAKPLTTYTGVGIIKGQKWEVLLI